MMLPTTLLVTALVLAGVSGAAEPSPPASELLPRACEIDLALFAAPKHLRPDATVYALTDEGYVQVRDGGNGFTCIGNSGEVAPEDRGKVPFIAYAGPQGYMIVRVQDVSRPRTGDLPDCPDWVRADSPDSAD